MLASAKIDIDSLVKLELTPLPGTAMRVANLTQDFDASARSIASAIGLDPILSARVLRAANSPIYAVERRVTALPIAVNTLGNNTIYTIVMMSSAADTFRQKGPQSSIGRTLWEHSVGVALAARETIKLLGMRGEEEAFLCGLLHDIGKLLLLRYDPETYMHVITESGENGLIETEMEIYGYTHAQVGAHVSSKWELPEEFSYTISNHHHPSEAGQSMLMARVIDVADQMANAAGIGLTTGSESDLHSSESVIALRLSRDQLTLAWENAEKALYEMMSVFG